MGPAGARIIAGSCPVRHLLCGCVGVHWRWHYLLRPIKTIPLGRLFPIVCIGYFGNNVYPARAGEVIRAFVLRRNDGVSVSASLATVIIERVFDGLVMLLFVFFALPFVGAEHIPPIYRTAVTGFSVLFFAALGAFFWMAFDQRRVGVVYSVPIGWCLRFPGAVGWLLCGFMDGLRFLRNPADVLMVFVTSLVIWLTETVKYWFVEYGAGGKAFCFVRGGRNRFLGISKYR